MSTATKGPVKRGRPSIVERCGSFKAAVQELEKRAQAGESKVCRGCEKVYHRRIRVTGAGLPQLESITLFRRSKYCCNACSARNAASNGHTVQTRRAQKRAQRDQRRAYSAFCFGGAL